MVVSGGFRYDIASPYCGSEHRNTRHHNCLPQNNNFGFPTGRLHQTERAGISHLEKVKAFILDSPQGDYTRRRGQVFSTSNKSKP